MTILKFKDLFLFFVEIKSGMFYQLFVLVGWMRHFNSWVVQGQDRHVADPGTASCSTWFYPDFPFYIRDLNMLLPHTHSAWELTSSGLFPLHLLSCTIKLDGSAQIFWHLWESFCMRFCASTAWSINGVLTIIAIQENAKDGKGILSSLGKRR